MATDLVSIIVVGHNNWPDLDLAIQCSLLQSHRPVEVIVVDNDSTDETLCEVQKLYGKSVRYIRQENRGDSGGYNTGMQAARGDFIQFLDGDDFLAPNKIEKQLQAFREHPETDIVYGNFRKFQSLAGPARWEDIDIGDYVDMLAFFIDTGGALAPHSLLYRRQVLKRVGMFDESLYIADVDYWLRAAAAGCRFRYCPDSWCFYRVRPQQMTANIPAMLRGAEAVWVKALGYLSTEPHRAAVINRLARSRWFLAVRRDNMSIRDGLAKLTQARATDGDTISIGLFLLGALLILPVGRPLVRMPQLRTLRGWLKGFVNFG